MEEIKAGQLEHKVREMIKHVGKVGLIARGVVVGIIGYLFLRAAIESNASKAGGTEGAFSFIQDSSYGSILLGIVAIGLACYGAYMLVKARYKALPANM